MISEPKPSQAGIDREFKDIRKKNFKVLLQSDNELLVSNPNKLGVTNFILKTKHVESTDFKKLVHIIQHGLQGFLVKNFEGESLEASDFSHTL